MKHRVRGSIFLAAAVSGILLAGCTHTSYQVDAQPVENSGIKIQSAAEHLADAIRIRTISYTDTSATESAAFDSLLHFMSQTYPQVNTQLQRELINHFGVLYYWQGKNKSLKPIILMGHTDVVPADTSQSSPWQHAPSAGEITDDTVWGRGTLDDKLAVFGILEAAEYLLNKNFQPERSIYFAFGYDEEIGGAKGAAQIAAALKQRQINADLILDEGGVIVTEGVPGISAPVALVGIAEKGYVSLQLTAHGAGGHSSIPPKPDATAIGMLSQAIVDLNTHPMPGGLDGPVKEMLVTLAPETGFPYNFLFSNLWAFGGIIESQLAHSPKSNALIRTTTAPTMIEGGLKDNVIPSEAAAVVNFRLKPGDTVESLISHVTKVIDNSAITISIYGDEAQPASTVSDYKNVQFKTLAKSIRQTFPDVLVSPYISVGGTDAKHYEGISTNIYRFLPVIMSTERLDELHGVDEHITTDEYKQLINFYIQMMSNATGPNRDW